MEHEDVRNALAEYLERFPDDAERLAPVEAALSETWPDVPLRRNAVNHLTAGAILVDRRTGTALQIRHRALGRWLMPGGHVEDEDASLVEAAKRELVEETGDVGRNAILLSGVPIDIDPHVIPVRPERAEAAHLHFDFRYIFERRSGATETPAREIESFRWSSLYSLGKLGTRVLELLADA